MIRSRLPRMLPVMEAFTRSTRPARSATSAMISSAALPKVALSRPPTVGPGAVGQVLGRLAHVARQRQHAETGGEEDPHRRGVQDVAEHHADGNGRQQQQAPAGRAALLEMGWEARVRLAGLRCLALGPAARPPRRAAAFAAGGARRSPRAPGPVRSRRRPGSAPLTPRGSCKAASSRCSAESSAPASRASLEAASISRLAWEVWAGSSPPPRGRPRRPPASSRARTSPDIQAERAGERGSADAAGTQQGEENVLRADRFVAQPAGLFPRLGERLLGALAQRVRLDAGCGVGAQSGLASSMSMIGMPSSTA